MKSRSSTGSGPSTRRWKISRQLSTQSTAFHPEDPSTFCVATLLLPSKFAWMDGDGELPSPDYTNKLDMLFKLNRQIKLFNNEVFKTQEELYERMLGDNWSVIGLKSHAPAFHTFGIRKRTFKRAGEKVGTSDHRWLWWRETGKALRMSENLPEEEKKVALDRAKMDALHLTDKHRGKMAKACDNYFTNMFEPLF